MVGLEDGLESLRHTMVVRSIGRSIWKLYLYASIPVHILVGTETV